jgi:N-dimethylarginine dimethylaminohydrolase
MPTGSTSASEIIKDRAVIARLLMCAPQFFEVTYEINQWMQPETWRRNRAKFKQNAEQEWQLLYKTFQLLGVAIELVPPRPGVPDMVFTANAAIVLNKCALLARFRYKERQPEEKYFVQHFQLMKESGMIEAVDEFPAGILQEGVGDCIWDSERQIFWAGYGPRSSKEAATYIQSYYDKSVVALELLSSRFYHLDLSLSPLKSGEILYYPGAFSEQSQKIIKEHVPADQLIAIDKEDAFNFVCNLVNVEKKIILSRCSDKLKNQLQERGYSVVSVPVDTFGLAGGSICCLTLKLDLHSH